MKQRPLPPRHSSECEVYGLYMDKGEYIEPTKDQIVMAFVASCVESVAERMKLAYREVLERMDKVGMIDNYIYPFYEQLHTESRENLTESLIDTLQRWESGKDS